MITKPCYVADFETTTRNNKECVWLWDICNIVTLKHTTGITMDSFLQYINDIKTPSTIYFHNLKFDGSFIVDYLLKNGYELQNVDTNKLKKHHFNLLVTEYGAFFKLNFKNKNNKIIEFVDSLKILPIRAEKLAKDFNLPVLKGKIDYDKNRPDNYIPSNNEIEYVKNDTEIVARCLEIFLEQGHTKITLSSCAFDDYKKIIGQSKYNAWFGKWAKNACLETDIEIRKSYRGGFCQCNKDYINTTIKQPVWYNDVNSLYPYIMRTAKLPYDLPVEYQGKYEYDEKHPYYIQKILVDMVVKDDGIPCILNKGKGVNCKYIVDTSNDDTTCGLQQLTLTCFDLELLFKNYDVYEIRYIGGYKFKVRNDMFTDYVEKYYIMKKDATITGNGALRTEAKLFLNGLYGKFGQNPVRRKKLPFVDYDNKIKYYKTDKTIAKKFNYLPVAVFVTSLARYKVLNDIEKIGKENWLYTDTDSILSLKRLDADMLDNEELGKYKIEQIFKKTRVLGPKTYWGNNTRNEITAKACGCNRHALKDFPIGKFNYGEKVKNGRTTLKTVVGGKKIDFADFTIRDKRIKYNIKQREIKPIDTEINTIDWK